MKGFTLIEVLWVLILLGAISLVTIPIVTNVIKDNKKTLYDIQIKNIEGSSRNFVAENLFKLDLSEGKKLGITLKKLKELGYLEENAIDPQTSDKFNDSTVVIISNKNNDILYTVCATNECDLDGITYYGE